MSCPERHAESDGGSRRSDRTVVRIAHAVAKYTAADTQLSGVVENASPEARVDQRNKHNPRIVNVAAAWPGVSRAASVHSGRMELISSAKDAVLSRIR
jgi:hypothetical protein